MFASMTCTLLVLWYTFTISLNFRNFFTTLSILHNFHADYPMSVLFHSSSAHSPSTCVILELLQAHKIFSKLTPKKIIRHFSTFPYVYIARSTVARAVSSSLCHTLFFPPFSPHEFTYTLLPKQAGSPSINSPRPILSGSHPSYWVIIFINIIIIIKTRSAVQGWERVMYTPSV